MHADTDFGVGTGRREGFDAMTERETISAQDNGFFGVSRLTGVDGFEAIDVADEVNESELSEVESEWLTNDVSNNVGSLDGAGVAKGVRTAISLDVSSANSAFDVEGGVTDAGTAFGVCSASFASDVDTAGGVDSAIDAIDVRSAATADSLVDFF